MNEPARSRGEVLNTIKEAELDGARRVDNARARAAQVKANTMAESSNMIEQAEKEGRAAMRQALEAAREECAAARKTRVVEAMDRSRAQESASLARIPAVAEMMHRKFAEEHNVKD